MNAEFSLSDYNAMRAVVEDALAVLKFEDPVQEFVGHELLAMLNRTGALLEYQKKGDKRHGEIHQRISGS